MPDMTSVESAERIAGVPVLRDPEAFRQWCQARRRAGQRLGLVPTMGALHAGHLSLAQLARQHADAVVVTIFVNPLQFGAHEDLDRYPRTLTSDCAQCAAAGVDAVFAPAAGLMYPPGFQSHVEVEQVSQRWCGASRPGHFRGVATVVLKLLNLAMADVAVFGEKDWQQLAVLRRMVRDLDHPTRVLGAPIVRDADGLALSSRNVYLSAEQRRAALVLSQGLARLCQGAARGEGLRQLEAELAAAIAQAGGTLDYVAAVDAESLEPLTQLDRPGRALVAAWFGSTRLLDNAPL